MTQTDSAALCLHCGIDEVPWPKRTYCSAVCRRRAAYERRRLRLVSLSGQGAMVEAAG